jgi:hypothetical protein
LEGGFGLWLGDNSDIVNRKTSTFFHILTGYGPTPPSLSLNVGSKHSHYDIDIVEELLLGLLAGLASKTLSLGLLAGLASKTLSLGLLAGAVEETLNLRSDTL